MQISQEASGYGTSGCLSASFDLEVYDAEQLVINAPKCAEVQLTCTTNANIVIPKFFINTREVNCNLVRLHCSDRMIKTDQICSITAEDFGDSDTKDTSLVLTAIVNQCGFSSYGIVGASGLSDCIPTLTYDEVFGQSCRTILDLLATALNGNWICSPDNRLIFVEFGSVYSATSAINPHTKVTAGCARTFSRVEVTDGTDTYSSGSGSGALMRVNTPYASSALASAIYSNLNGYTYTDWQCEHGISSLYFAIPSQITFADGVSRVCNSATFYPTASGLFVTCGRNAVTENEWDYSGALERQIKNKIGIGDNVGGVALSKKDAIIVFKNNN